MNEQGSLFSQAHTKAGIVERPVSHPARHTDPASSHVAATRLRNSGRLAGQRHEVLRVLARQTDALDAGALAKASGFLDATEFYYACCRRLPELKRLGYVEAIDALPAQLWRITEAGRMALRGMA